LYGSRATLLVDANNEIRFTAYQPCFANRPACQCLTQNIYGIAGTCMVFNLSRYTQLLPDGGRQGDVVSCDWVGVFKFVIRLRRACFDACPEVPFSSTGTEQ
jgi:hypothetical protein